MTEADPWPQRARLVSDLLARTAIGDRDALAKLYQATSAHLFGVILRINPDRAQAEDVLQDTYVNVWRAAQGFDTARGQALAWLTSIARHRAIDSLRRRNTAPRTVSTHVDDGEEESDLLDGVASEAAGPLDLLQRAAEARAVTRCLQQLSPAQQQCMALAFYQGLSHSEVAEHLAQPLGTVKSWMRRALGALRDCLDRSAHTARA